jgi:tetratricopeptide (TPR) repeat protein
VNDLESASACTDIAAGALLLPYALGTLDAAEMERFEEHLLHCASCRDELQAASGRLRELRAQRGQIVRSLNDGKDQGETPPVLVRRDRPRWVWPQAAPPLSQNVPPVKTEQTATTAPNTEPALAALATRDKLPYTRISSRGTQNDFEDRFGKAMTEYETGQLASAREQLLALSERAPDHAEVWLYLGVTAYLSDDLDLAESSLRQGLAQHPRTIHRQHLRWYLANLELRRGGAPEARTLLEAIVAENTERVADARQLLDLMDQVLARH